ncbi:MAG: IS110 family transposase [Rhizobacter sp.]
MTKTSQSTCVDPRAAPAVMGVDVASMYLDAAAYGSSGVVRFANTDGAVAKWLRALPAGSIIALESTGRYHERLAFAAHAKGFTVYLLNPRDVRHYARAMGMRGKTDKLDAQILARYAAHEGTELRAWVPPSPELRRLEDLLRRRGTLVKHQGAIRQSLADSTLLRASAKPLMKEFTKLLDCIDQQIAQAAAELNLDCEGFERITSVPGIGLLSGSALLGVFQRLGERSADAVIAFLGLDPRPMDSGKKVGLRRLSKRGPAEWRRLLFNAAMSASRTKAWSATYERERAKGLPRTAALNVLARKLVRVAFGLFKSGQHFDSSKLAPP